MKSMLMRSLAIVCLAVSVVPALAEEEAGKIELDESGNIIVQGKVSSKKVNEKRTRFYVGLSVVPKTPEIEALLGKYVTVTGAPDPKNPNTRIKKIISIEAMDAEAIKKYEAQFDREFESSPNAKPFMGAWGPRVCIPSAMRPTGVEEFDGTKFWEQISKLTTADYIMANVTQPAGGCYFTGPHPELAEALKLEKPSFPTRDVLGETLDKIKENGKKALVYFGAKALHADRASDETKAAWDKHIEALGMTHHEATRKLILKHYAEKYGTKIDGWWFDGSGDIDEPERILWRKTILANNPKAIMVFNRMAGAPYRSTRQCDYFGGHTTPIVKEAFWSMANERMITDIEASPWMGIRESRPVKEGYGALGHVFMGMQAKWTMGKRKFPPKQAIDWTTRVLAAGGMFTWAVPFNRTIPAIPSEQFDLLLKINKEVKRLRSGEDVQPEADENGQQQKRKKRRKKKGE